MKARIPGTLFATSINLISLTATDDLPRISTGPSVICADRDAEEGTELPGVRNSPLQDASNVSNFSVKGAISAEREWTRATEARFQKLATKEALETITAAELAEIENLTRVRRIATAPKATAAELLEELRQWRSLSRVVSALQSYVEEIGVDARFKNRSQKHSTGQNY